MNNYNETPLQNGHFIIIDLSVTVILKYLVVQYKYSNVYKIDSKNI